MPKFKHLDIIAIIISIISVFCAALSLRQSYNSSNFELNKFMTELEPSLEVKFNANKDSILFSIREEDAILQNGSIFFAPIISNELLSWGYYGNRIGIEELKEPCEDFIARNYNFKSLDSLFYVVTYPFPIVVHYNVIVNGKPIDFRGLYNFYFNFVVTDKNKISLRLEYIHKISSLPIPLKSHWFIKKPFQDEVPMAKIMKRDSIDLVEILNSQMKIIMNQEKFKKHIK